MVFNKIRNIFVSRTQNLCPQQMLRARANGETFVSATMCPQHCVRNTVSTTMCPRLSGPLVTGEIIGSLGVICKEKLAFINGKISAGQKR